MACRILTASAPAFAVALALAPVIAQAQGPSITANGPPTPGVCVFSKEQTLQTSKAGASAAEQIRQFAAAASAKLKPERDAIAQENQTLMDQRANLTPTQLQQRAIALQQKSAQFQEVSQQRTAQLQQTQVNAANRIMGAATPVLTAASAAHRCSVIFERGQVYGFNPAMDLTAEVIKKLDAALPPFKVELAAAPATPVGPRK
jgi:Skp family chaperone for outer membrane proteins